MITGTSIPAWAASPGRMMSTVIWSVIPFASPSSRGTSTCTFSWIALS